MHAHTRRGYSVAKVQQVCPKQRHFGPIRLRVVSHEDSVFPSAQLGV